MLLLKTMILKKKILTSFVQQSLNCNGGKKITDIAKRNDNILRTMILQKSVMTLIFGLGPRFQVTAQSITATL